MGHEHLLFASARELDLTRQAAVDSLVCRAPAGGRDPGGGQGRRHSRQQQLRRPSSFATTCAIQTNVIDAAYRQGTRKLLFLGSSCIYPKLAPQPMNEDCLLTGPLEPTNEWYAIAKIAGIKMCQAYRRAVRL